MVTAPAGTPRLAADPDAARRGVPAGAVTMGHLFHRTLVRRITVSLVLTFLVIYVVTAVYVIRQQRLKEESGEVLLSIGPAFVQALASATTPEQARAMAVALDATTNGYRVRVAVPNPMLIQLWDKPQGRWVFASPLSSFRRCWRMT